MVESGKTLHPPNRYLTEPASHARWPLMVERARGPNVEPLALTRQAVAQPPAAKLVALTLARLCQGAAIDIPLLLSDPLAAT